MEEKFTINCFKKVMPDPLGHGASNNSYVKSKSSVIVPKATENVLVTAPDHHLTALENNLNK